jgi:hypothetical protein
MPKKKKKKKKKMMMMKMFSITMGARGGAGG